MSGSRVLVALRVAAPPERTFSAFSREIGQWWRPNKLFRFTDRPGGRLAFEPDPPERLVEIGSDGERFEIGPVTIWEPPLRLAFGWRQAGFPDGVSTEVSVSFEPVENGTRVTVNTSAGTTYPKTTRPATDSRSKRSSSGSPSGGRHCSDRSPPALPPDRKDKGEGSQGGKVDPCLAAVLELVITR